MGMLDGKVAIVTGAGRGIGREEALLLASEGAKVIVNDVGASLQGEGDDKHPAEEVVELIKAGGSDAAVNASDVSSWEGAKALIDQAVDTFGQLDILISNAGIQIVNPIVDYSFADWKKMQAIHVDGAFLTTKAALKHMYAGDRGGVVIYMGSVHSHEASPLKSAT